MDLDGVSEYRARSLSKAVLISMVEGRLDLSSLSTSLTMDRSSITPAGLPTDD